MSEGPVDECLKTAGELPDASQHDCQLTPEANRELHMFRKCLRQITKEYNQCAKDIKPISRTRVMEVFCGPQSQLTAQCHKLGHSAIRFGYEQGDLSTAEGRITLLQWLFQYQPEHVWYSPTCGPWSGWSNLNGSLSIAAWDEIQMSRLNKMYQLALGVVILRHQRQHGRHMHWEQPAKSQMFRVPYLQEVRYYMLSVLLDLCTAGDLRDPETNLLMKKQLDIMTTSPRFVEQFKGYRCHHSQPHQVVSGKIKVDGSWINRTSFTENYPRKFARLLAKHFGRVHVHREKPSVYILRLVSMQLMVPLELPR